MKLNERKIRILEAIITDYIATAEPIGSRTIAKKYNLGISPATIRNEMSDLEDLGYIEQVHTSSGRVPSQLGYRLYVDNLMKQKELSVDEIEFLKNAISLNVSRVEYLMEQTAKALAMLTNYTTVVTEPKDKKSAVRIKHIQLVPVDEKTIAAVIVTDNKAIKNHIISLSKSPDMDELNKISNSINKELKGMSLDSFDRVNVSHILERFITHQELIAKVIKAIITTIQEEEDVHLYTSGVRNILGFPEFSNVEKAKNIFQALEEKEMLITLLGKGDDNDEERVQILIGGENNLDELKDCSIVKAKYKYNNSYGKIGVIGPTRMNYSQTVSVINEIVKTLDSAINSILDDDKYGGKDG
ncbi:MAG: heat-inducible transcriptional repressor HrcA [Lachnospirales bacterium]